MCRCSKGQTYVLKEVKTIKNGKSIRAWAFVFVLMLVLLLSSMIIWTSAEPAALSLTITATGDFRGKGDRFRASSGVIVVAFPSTSYTYEYEYSKTIDQVTSTVSYIAVNLGTLTLVEEIMVEIGIDGSFRRLSIDETAPITWLFIAGCEAAPDNGFQYCVSASSSNRGTVTRTGSNTWWVDASIPASIPGSGQGTPSLCVAECSGGKVVDGFCIPLYNLQVVCTGIITK